ncbi:filamentous hemagglutinin N-terminal domain-containing protein [Pleurocapsa sp. PCC 7319]|uniref:two-partner secretion domain-containing protein n=1 Tax=Pleurocapsa sp. PCC 7319 TaxID=118161 RepID=UPI000347C36E|nr:filamentous hemagglutinin N-terminal domain-containing protein [Pleurocapsa sp. PCC 7319]
MNLNKSNSHQEFCKNITLSKFQLLSLTVLVKSKKSERKDNHLAWLMTQSDRQNKNKKLGFFSWVVSTTVLISFFGDMSFGIGLLPALAQSQIVPDNSLGNENSTVVPNGQIEGLPAELIEGGAQRGANLFHSFQEFNIGEGQRVDFADPAGIDNILTRITGSNISNIMGTLGVDGSADLFLLNPNGIIFGENASLDINGSFVGTTADAIQFGDQGLFTATEPNTPPLLTVKPSALFFNQMNSGRIENRSIAPAGFDILDTPLSGLRVPNGESLLLVGGEVIIDGGSLHALNGRVELLGIEGEESIEFNTDENRPALNLPSQPQLADISIVNGAFINTSDRGGGAIHLRGKNINITDESFVFADTLGDLDGQGISITAENLLLNNGSRVTTDILGSGAGGNISIDTRTLNIENGSAVSSSSFEQGDRGNNGNIDINAIETISLNTGSSIINEIRSNVVGNGGNINLATKSLSLNNGSLISTTIFGKGNGGNINIDATEKVSVIEGASFNSDVGGSGMGQSGNITITGNNIVFDGGFARSRLGTGGEGSAGDIQITTGSLLVTGIPPELTGNTGQLVTATFGQGDAGNLTIDATEDVTFDGRGSDVFSLIGGNLEIPNIGPAEGNAGDIEINSKSLSINNQARLVSSVEGIGDAGKIDINTNTLSITNGGSLSTTVSDTGIGNAGNIEIVTGTLDVINGGLINSGTSRSGNAGNISITATDSVILTETEDNNLDNELPSTITTSFGPAATGKEGNLIITTPNLEISDRSAIIATAQGQGNGGNIQLLDLEILLLRNNGLISTTAGIEGTGGDGGNIHIDTDVLVAFPSENSDIIANAFQGDGGNIDIDAQGIFGIEQRRATEDNITNDIDASSEFGFSGEVEINIYRVDPSQDSLSISVAPVEAKVAQICESTTNGNRSEFVVTGRGGLPDSPEANLNGDFGLEDWRVEEDSWLSASSSNESTLRAEDEEFKPIVEADSWIVNDRGKVVLIAHNAPNPSSKLAQQSAPCQID